MLGADVSAEWLQWTADPETVEDLMEQRRASMEAAAAKLPQKAGA